MTGLFLEVMVLQHYLTLPVKALLEQNLWPTHMNTEVDKDVLSQVFGEQDASMLIWIKLQRGAVLLQTMTTGT